MPKIARQHATYVETMAGFEGSYEDLDGYTNGFEAGTQDTDPIPLFLGLAPPGDAHRQQGARVGALEVIAMGDAPSESPVYKPDGIAEDITYCTGIWDGSAIARHAAEAPTVWR